MVYALVLVSTNLEVFLAVLGENCLDVFAGDFIVDAFMPPTPGYLCAFGWKV